MAITGTINHQVNLSTSGNYASPLTIATTGEVDTAVYQGAVLGSNAQAWTVDNLGTIVNTYDHRNTGAVFLRGGGDVANGSTGTTSALIDSNNQFGILIEGGVGTVVNYATIEQTTYSSLASSGVYLEDGLTLNSYQGSMADVDFNGSSPSLKSIATSSGLEVSGNTTLTFNGGTVTVKTTSSTQTYTIPASGGIIYVANNGTTTGTKSGMIYLEGGTVTGPLTVASESDMYIENNITYTHNPVTTPTSTDALGLISQDNIWVDSGAPNSLTIDAAMIAAGTSSGGTGSFGAVNYTSRSAGTLTVYGGIVQEIRGAVATVNGSGNVLTGYAKNYSYDPRFLTTPPPNYPVVSGQINFSQWQESGNGK